MAVILDAGKICEDLEKKIKKEVSFLPKLCLASVAFGKDYSTEKYRLAQKKAAERLSVEYYSLDLPENSSFSKLKLEMERLNNDSNVSGIIINKPFPSQWSDEEVFSLIVGHKDVEGTHPINLGRLLKGKNFPISLSAAFNMTEPLLISPTVLSILHLLLITEIKLRGKKVVLVGFSSLIGKPLALILGDQFATVIITHIGTYEQGDLEGYVRGADVIISAVGKPHLIKGAWIKKGAVIIDAGTAEKEGKLTGDVEFTEAAKTAAFITPVPGGVGKLTPMFLYYNLVIAAKLLETKGRA